MVLVQHSRQGIGTISGFSNDQVSGWSFLSHSIVARGCKGRRGKSMIGDRKGWAHGGISTSAQGTAEAGQDMTGTGTRAHQAIPDLSLEP